MAGVQNPDPYLTTGTVIRLRRDDGAGLYLRCDGSGQVSCEGGSTSDTYFTVHRHGSGLTLESRLFPGRHLRCAARGEAVHSDGRGGIHCRLHLIFHPADGTVSLAFEEKRSWHLGWTDSGSLKSPNHTGQGRHGRWIVEIVPGHDVARGVPPQASPMPDVGDLFSGMANMMGGMMSGMAQWAAFAKAAGADGVATAAELQGLLSESGLSAYPRPGGTFSIETCRLLINMLDQDHMGTLNFEEYKTLCAVIEGWKTTFATHDVDRSGAIEADELAGAIASYGYRLSGQALNCITARYSKHSNQQIVFDDFIALSVRLRLTSDKFRQHDRQGQGFATLSYEDFITISMGC